MDKNNKKERSDLTSENWNLEKPPSTAKVPKKNDLKNQKTKKKRGIVNEENFRNLCRDFYMAQRY